MASLRFEFPGMGDVESYYLYWIKRMEIFGIVGAYKQVGGFDQYPPLAVFTAFLIKQILNVTYLIAWKLAGSMSLLFTALICHQITKSKWISQLPIFFLGVPTILYGYADIHVAPFLLFSLSLLIKERYFLSGILFAVSCLFKWQPMIMFAAIVLYMLFKKRYRKTIEFSLGAAAIALITVIVYGWYNPAKSIWLSSLNHYFSAWGPNLNWIVTWILSIYFPEKLSGLGIWGGGPGSGGSFASLKGDPKKGLFLITKGIFYFAYLIQILLYIFKTSATELNVLRLAAASSLVYWQFSTGVHANHIFFLMPLAILLCWKKNEYIMPFTIIFLLVNLNLIRALGYDGIGSGNWPDIIFGINPSLILSFLAVASSFYLIGVLFRDSFYEEDKKKVHS